MAVRPPTRPTSLLLAACLLGLEALASLTVGAVVLSQLGLRREDVVSGALVLMLAWGVLLLVLARGVFLGRRWSRGPTVATQLLLLATAVTTRGESTSWVAGATAVAAVGTLVGVLHPRSTEIFVRPRPSS